MWIVFASNASCWCVLFCRFFLVAFLSPAGNQLAFWMSRLLCFVAFPNGSTSELRARFAPRNWYKPFYKIFLLTVLFCESFMFFASCVSHAFATVHCCLVVTCWERLTSRHLLVMFIE